MQSIMDRLIGVNWRTTLGGVLMAAGSPLAVGTTGRWQMAGTIMLSVGGFLCGAMARDRAVSAEDMRARREVSK